MKENEVFVLASETIDENESLASWLISGVTRDPKVARAWAAGCGHQAYLAEIDSDLVVTGLPAVEY